VSLLALGYVDNVGAGSIPGVSPWIRSDLLGPERPLREIDPIEEHGDKAQDERPDDEAHNRAGIDESDHVFSLTLDRRSAGSRRA